MGEKVLPSGDRDSMIVEIIEKAMTVPGVKVDRKDFLNKFFDSSDPERRARIIEVGPVEAGCSREELLRLAKGLVNKRTLESSGFSFAAGIPGGIAMAGTIPADLLQYYGFALRLAQEIAYLYGAEDLWSDDGIDSDKVLGTFIVYLGTMFGASGASATLKTMSSALSQQALKKIPNMALTKTFYYPIVKSIAQFFGKSMTKEVFAKGVAKAIPIIGGIASGGLTLVSMRPMGMRLVYCLDDAKFDYTEEDLEQDIIEIQEVIAAEEEREREVEEKAAESGQTPDEALEKMKSLLDGGFIDKAEYEAFAKRIKPE
ncbi:MAG: hypothetical protein IJI68_05205 [Eggerthellaceae bacterium]|nr:hypothetical protein [Eggerthellaceae bacterium]